MITIFHLLTSFFFNFIGSDYPITVDSIENYDAIQYYFFTNFLAHKYLWDVQILLRFSLKVDFAYSDFQLPVELMYLYQQAEKIEQEKKDKATESSSGN